MLMLPNRIKARAFLVEMLASGNALPFDMIRREAKARGVDIWAVRDVRKGLGIIVRGAGPSRTWEDPLANLM